jgi:hypothetical protein
MFTRRAALRVAFRAVRRLDVPRRIALYIAFAARKEKVPYAVAFALFEQESNYEVIYGHDAGGLLPGEKVTKRNYAWFRSRVVSSQGRGANGVGLGQVTYWTYIRDHPGLWKPRVQVYLSLEILRSYLNPFSQFTALGAYNGGPTNPNEDYAAEVEAKARAIRPKLSK